YQLAHDVAGQRSGGGAAYRRGPPFVGVVLRLIERQRGRARRGRDDVERRTKAPTGGRFARWRVQGREQAPGLILHSLPPGEGGGGRGTGQLLETLAELDHVGLRASCAPPDGDTVGQTGDGDGQKRRGEEPADARHGMGHATATNRERAAAGQERRPHETLAGGWGVL